MQVSLAQVYSAGIARATGFAQQLDALLALDDEQVQGQLADLVARVNDLCFGLETAAQLPVGTEQDRVLAYLWNTYALGAVAQDPFLRPLLPPIPTTGATVRRFVLGTGNGRVLGNLGRLLGTRTTLEPNLS